MFGGVGEVLNASCGNCCNNVGIVVVVGVVRVGVSNVAFAAIVVCLGVIVTS